MTVCGYWVILLGACSLCGMRFQSDGPGRCLLIWNTCRFGTTYDYRLKSENAIYTYVCKLHGTDLTTTGTLDQRDGDEFLKRLSSLLHALQAPSEPRLVMNHSIYSLYLQSGDLEISLPRRGISSIAMQQLVTFMNEGPPGKAINDLNLINKHSSEEVGVASRNGIIAR